VPFGIGPLELVLVLVVLLVVFGAKRLPEIGRSLGSSAREFKSGITGGDDAPPSGERVSAANQDDKDARRPS
jgi:sec-independent protein translocase protein TatA